MEQFVEDILAFVAGLGNNVVDTLPVSYAFGTGMLAAVNPCGFALLPAYISFFLGDTGEGFDESQVLGRLLKGLMVSLAVTLGFVLLFGTAGLIITSGGQFLIDVMPWAGLGIGLLMILLGALLILGKTNLYMGMSLRLSARINTGPNNNILSYFLFGIAYGIASLSCSLPLFSIVVGLSFTASDFLHGMYQFISYALGMGATLMVLTLGTAVFKEVVGGYMRQAVPYVERASAGLITLAGAFLVYYWLTIGDLGEDIQGFF